ncbi:nuclear transport factor 2 family protein [Gordonia sp. ABSL1-1]|uniref:nuclear transport factor 2 family protein n=1 Tax=Gordonia sp. ABSL1-1 TaxID=3053923 RepID=UPI002572DC09|nr:nuclear transport factor 2 family protein [Gordonia sp. ABSL1-1]MDL9935607.1 nuclear transport factor 2 family protein [Gordonia sp. ABSL1-1]
MTEQHLPTPVAASLEATNAGDREGFLASFTADGAVDDWGRVFVGRERIGGWSDAEFIGKKVTLAVNSVSVADDEVTVVATVGGNGFNGPSTFVYTVAGDQIARMTIRE